MDSIYVGDLYGLKEQNWLQPWDHGITVGYSCSTTVELWDYGIV